MRLLPTISPQSDPDAAPRLASRVARVGAIGIVLLLEVILGRSVAAATVDLPAGGTCAVLVAAVVPVADESGPPPSFVPMHALLGTRVLGTVTTARIAVVDDLVIDARNGIARFAIITTDGELGAGKRTVAIPYGALSWDAKADLYTLNLPSQLERLPEFDPSKLERMQHPSWASTLRGIFGRRAEIVAAGRDRSDEHTRFIQRRTPRTIVGEVTAVQRHAPTRLGGTVCAVTIQDAAAGEETQVLLGPVAWLARRGVAPVTGESIAVEGAGACGVNGEPVFIASSIERAASRVELRGADGVAAWSAEEAVMPRRDLVLASDLEDRPLFARGVEVGRHTAFMFEAHSGAIAFAVLPAKKITGDRGMRLVIPFEHIALARESAVYTDLAIGRLTTAPVVDEDQARDLSRKRLVESIYERFEITPRRFETDRFARWSAREPVE
jgi:hypothetical protein